MSTTQIVARGSVIVYKAYDGSIKVTAVMSGPDAQRLQRRVGGRIVNAKGLAFRYGQQRQVRILVNPAEAVSR